MLQRIAFRVEPAQAIDILDESKRFDVIARRCLHRDPSIEAVEEMRNGRVIGALVGLVRIEALPALLSTLGREQIAAQFQRAARSKTRK